MRPDAFGRATASLVLAIATCACTPSAAQTVVSPRDLVARLAYAGSVPDGCFVLATADVERITGHTVANTVPFQRDAPGCSYNEPDGLVMGTRFWLKDGGPWSFDGMKAQADTVTIDGLGGEAIWLPAFRNLWVVKGEWVIGIIVGRITSDEERLALAKRLAGVLLPLFP